MSYYEFKITEWLEKNNIKFEKEVYYKDVILNDKTKRRFDWKITINKKIYYVEMFGILYNEEYKIKSKQKIKDCKINNIYLIAIYPEDLKNGIDFIFKDIIVKE